MSRPADPHDPTRDVARRDALTLAALGEPLDPDLAARRATCAECSGDLARLSQTVGLARTGAPPAPTPDVRPPDSVWNGIARELGVESAGASSPPPTTTDADVVPFDRPRRGRRRRYVLGAIAAAAVVAAGAGGYLVGHERVATGTCPSVSAQLDPVDGAAGGVAGSAQVVCSADGPALRVQTEQLPISTGYYEVWMYQPDTGVMVAVGTLGSNGAGTFTLPGGMDVRDYPVVDVSAQRYDGDPTHDRSVLQGPLTR